MTITSQKNANTLTVALAGRLDTTTAPQLEAALKQELASVTELILDFAALEYISSAGLRVLLSTQKIMNKRGSMTIRAANASIQEVFSVTGFTDILTIV